MMDQKYIFFNLKLKEFNSINATIIILIVITFIIIIEFIIIIMLKYVKSVILLREKYFATKQFSKICFSC